MSSSHTTLQLVGKIACLKYIGHLHGAHGSLANRQISGGSLSEKVGVNSDVFYRWVREDFNSNVDGPHFDSIVGVLENLQRRDTSGRDLGVRVGLTREHFEESFTKLAFAECLGLEWHEAHEIYDVVLARSIRARHYLYMDGSEADAFKKKYEGIYDVYYWNPYVGKSHKVIRSRLRIRNSVHAGNNASVVSAKLHMLAFDQEKGGTFHPYDGRVVMRGKFVYFYFEENSIEASSRNLRDMVTIMIAPGEPKDEALAGILSTTTREGCMYSSPVALRRVVRHVADDFDRAEVKVLMRDDLKEYDGIDELDQEVASILKQGNLLRVSENS